MPRHLLTLLLMLLALCGSTQAQVKGHVVLEDGSPAAYATAMLFADSNTSGTPPAYAITNAKGHFSIDAKRTAGAWLVVRYLGCKEYRQPLPAKSGIIEIKLQTDAKRLGEVTVEERYKSVEVSGDTIKFNTEYFKTGAEDNAAEVLNKIPGMEVDDNGDVSYGGKKVDRITVDGRDLFASGSDGALNTLSADAIKGAEIVRNARSNSIIDEFSGRELTTLNLKTDGRTRVNGKVSALAGYRNMGKSENSVLLMGKKVALTGILSANNTGEAVFSFSDYIRHVVGLDNLLSGRGRGFSFSDDELSMLIPPSNVYHSANGVATLSGTWQPSSKMKVKGSLIGNANALDAESLSIQEFYGLDLTNTHRLGSNSGNRFYSGNLQETWKPNDRIEISNSTRLTNTSMQQHDTLAEHGMADIDTWEKTHMRKVGISDEMVMNMQFDNDNLLSAHISFDHSRRNFSYGLFTNQALLPLPYYPPDGTLLKLDNNRHITHTQFSPDITYAIKLGHLFTLNATLAYAHTLSTFEHSTQQGDSTSATLASDNGSVDLSISKTKGVLRFSVGAEAVANRYHSTIGDIDGSHNSALLPNASIGLAFSSTHRIDLSASLSQSDIELENLLREPMVNGYNSLYGGSYIVDPRSKAANLSLNYYIYDLFSATMFVASAGVTRNRFTLKPYTQQDSSIVTRTVYDNNGQMQTEYLTAQLSKGLGDLPADLKVGGTVQHSASQTTINLTDGNLQSTSASVTVGCVTRSKKAINGEVGGSFITSASALGDSSFPHSSMNQYGAHAAIILNLRHLTGEVRFAYSYADNGSYQRDVYEIGFRVEYRIGKWRMLLRGSNVMNLGGMDWLSIASTANYLSTTQYRKVPGYILLGIAYRF